MNDIKLCPIGKVIAENDGLKIVLEPAYRAGLKGLSGYSHVQILWWMDKCDNPKDRATLKRSPIPKVRKKSVFLRSVRPSDQIQSQYPMRTSLIFMKNRARLVCIISMHVLEV